MQSDRPGFFCGRIRAFGCAFQGLRVMCATQPHAWLHATATIVVLMAGLWFRLAALEWLALAGAIGTVWIAESMNTAIEFVCDALHPERHPLIGNAKDVAAAGVLIAAAMAAVIGLIIFPPHL